MTTPQLFQPTRIGDIDVANRIVLQFRSLIVAAYGALVPHVAARTGDGIAAPAQMRALHRDSSGVLADLPWSEVSAARIGGTEPIPTLDELLEEFGVSYPNVFDTSGEIRRALGLRGFPTTYVFDAAGNLRTTIIGGVSEQRLAAVLDDLMA